MSIRSQLNRKTAKRIARWLVVALLISALGLAIRIGYAFTDAGRFARMFRQLRGEPEATVDVWLMTWKLLPATPQGPFRPFTLDEAAMLVDHEDYVVRRDAIKQLERAGDARAVRPSVEDLAKDHWATADLDKLLDRCGPGPFLDLLKHPNPDVRIVSAQQLLITKPEEAVAALAKELQQFQGGVWDLRRLVSEDRISGEEFEKRWRRYSRIMSALSSTQHPTVVAALRTQEEAEARIRTKAEQDAAERARLVVFGSSDRLWPLYAFLVPVAPDANQFLSVGIGGEPVIDIPPLKVQVTATTDEVSRRFGSPTQKAPNIVWAKAGLVGEEWDYGGLVRILFVDGKAARVTTRGLDERVVQQLHGSPPTTGPSGQLPTTAPIVVLVDQSQSFELKDTEPTRQEQLKDATIILSDGHANSPTHRVPVAATQPATRQGEILRRLAETKSGTTVPDQLLEQLVMKMSTTQQSTGPRGPASTQPSP